MGLYLSRELPKAAGRVLEKCVRKIAPEIMTWGQYAGKCCHSAAAVLAAISSSPSPINPLHRHVCLVTCRLCPTSTEIAVE